MWHHFNCSILTKLLPTSQLREASTHYVWWDRGKRNRWRQMDGGKNSWKNQMDVLWYLLSWQGQKVRIAADWERVTVWTQGSTSLWFGWPQIFSLWMLKWTDPHTHTHCRHGCISAPTTMNTDTQAMQQRKKCFISDFTKKKKKITKKEMLLIYDVNIMAAPIVLITITLMVLIPCVTTPSTCN